MNDIKVSCLGIASTLWNFWCGGSRMRRLTESSSLVDFSNTDVLHFSCDGLEVSVKAVSIAKMILRKKYHRNSWITIADFLDQKSRST